MPLRAAAPGFAVENARKMSPEPLRGMLPVRARPSEARRARRLSWCGSSGASVATTTMIEPRSSACGGLPGGEVRDLLAHRHAGDAQRLADPVVRLHQHADGVAARADFDLRDAVPMPPLNRADHPGAAADVAFGDRARFAPSSAAKACSRFT